MFDTKHFQEHGYQVFKDVLDPLAMEGVRRFLEGQVEQQVTQACAEIGCASQAEIVSYIGAIADTGEQAIDRLSKATKDTLSGHFSLEARLSPALWEIPRQPRLRELLEALLGHGDLFMHMPPTARFVLPGNGHAGVPAHQDISYNKHMSNFLTVWVPLVPIDDECGGVTVYEGSGHEPERLADGGRDKFWLQGVATDGFREVHCKIGIGDVLVLNKWVIHRSMPNRSRRTRYSIDSRYFGADDTSSKHYLDMQTFKVIAPGGQ